MKNSPAPLRLLSSEAAIRGLLLASGGFSVLGLGATVLAFVLVARAVAGALLDGTLPPIQTLAVIAATLLLRALGRAGREWVGQTMAARSVQNWRERLTWHALALGPVALAHRRGADLAALDAELGPRLTPFYARYLPGAVHAALAFVLVLAATFWLDPATAGLLLLTGPLTVLFLALVGLATRAATTGQWTAHTRLTGRLLTLTRNLPTLHAFGAVGTYRNVLGESAAQHRETTLKVLKIAFLSGFVMDFAATISTALIAVWIGVRLFGGEATLAPTLAALMLVPEFFGPLRQVGADRHAALDAEPLAEQLAEVLAVQVAPSGNKETGPRVPHLLFLEARADLNADTSPLSLELLPGTFAALRGPSGSGKTTFLHALRKHVPHAGDIEVDGIELDELDAATWQTHVAFVPQHPRLISASVAENLRLWKPGATHTELRAVARSVGLNAVLDALPQGWDTPLGEGGVLLSGGETARLALARALLSGARVILLDEVTAHLDLESEAEVMQAITSAFAGRTVILATHRPAPVGWLEVRLSPVQLPEVAA
ncbi:thiol reductant ABC exporter subunit CydD [Deinococcus arenicola]|uniref:Thiol reductant ABC exporter subunit CydD n=1 Tax=Deinococcus arenicola TaxID=2994950 RepID=A0ABU4DVT4_9DEIO|nr:thiol reductant ABC exporter subunit CydD [Deinococcus sp. ZS9-10]MDV6376545.1 thiol reductant ABC exporter subunit CydD [Deinococcus sp. ZS9-10]